MTDDDPRQACQPPWQQAQPHLASQGLPLRGGVAHPAGGAPPANARGTLGHERGPCPAHAPPACRAPHPAAPRGQGCLARPPEGHQAPTRPRPDRLDVAAQQRTALRRPLDPARLRGMPRPRELLQDLGDNRTRTRGGGPCTTADHHRIGRPRAAPQGRVALGPIPLPHVPVEVGHQRAADAPRRASPRCGRPATVFQHSDVPPLAQSLPHPPVPHPTGHQAPQHRVVDAVNGGLDVGIHHRPATHQGLFAPVDRLGRTARRSNAIGGVLDVGLDARLAHQRARWLHHAIPPRGHPQPPGSAIWRGHGHPQPRRQRVLPALQVVGHGLQEAAAAGARDIGEAPAIAPCAAARGPYCLPGPPPHVGPEDALIARLEPSIPAPFGRSGLAGAGVVVLDLGGVVGRVGPAPSLTSPLGSVAAAGLPSCRVLWSRRSSGLRPPPTSQAAAPWTSACTCSHGCPWMGAPDALRPPVFHRLRSQPAAPPPPSSASRLHLQTLRLFPGLHLACKARLSCVPDGFTSRRGRVHVRLRTPGVPRRLAGIRRFSTLRHPRALGACTVALWR